MRMLQVGRGRAPGPRRPPHTPLHAAEAWPCLPSGGGRSSTLLTPERLRFAQACRRLGLIYKVVTAVLLRKGMGGGPC